MKILIILITLLCVFSNSYSEVNVDSLKIISIRIIENPHNLKNFRLNFPEIVNTKIKNYTLSDSSFVNELIDFIENRFNSCTDSIVSKILNFNEYNFDYLSMLLLKNKIDSNKIYNLALTKHCGFGLIFSYYLEGNKFTLLSLKNIQRFPEIIYQLNDTFRIILKKPELLTNLEKSFPSYYNKKYIDGQMLDSTLINELIKKIKNLNNEEISNADFTVVTFDQYTFDEFNKNYWNGLLDKKEDCINFSFCFDKFRLNFIFYRIQGKEYINQINTDLYKKIKEEK